MCSKIKRASHGESSLSALARLKGALSSDEFRTFERHRTSFNMFKALKISDFEVRHSNMLAWLMDPREKHGLNGRFLKDLMAKIRTSDPRRYKCLSRLGDKDFSSCIVLREEDYRDIQVEFPAAKVVLVIENKWNAGEAEGGANDGGQLQRYSKAVDSQFGGDWQKVFVFLTPEERSVSFPVDYHSAPFYFVYMLIYLGVNKKCKVHLCREGRVVDAPVWRRGALDTGGR